MSENTAGGQKMPFLVGHKLGGEFLGQRFIIPGARARRT